MRFHVLSAFAVMLCCTPMASASVAIDWEPRPLRAASQAHHRNGVASLALLSGSSSLTKLAIYIFEQLSNSPAAASEPYKSLHSGDSIGDSALVETPFHKAGAGQAWGTHQAKLHGFSNPFAHVGTQPGSGHAGLQTAGFASAPSPLTPISFETSTVVSIHPANLNVGAATGTGSQSEPEKTPLLVVVPEPSSIAVWSLVGVTLMGVACMRRGRSG